VEVEDPDPNFREKIERGGEGGREERIDFSKL